MQIKSFEDIIAWQKAKELNVLLFSLFSESKHYNFKDQMLRATVSVMNNIAEGYERNGNKDFRNFLYIAKGSCAEVRSMLYLAIELKYLKENEFQKAYNLSIEVSRLLSGFIKTLK